MKDTHYVDAAVIGRRLFMLLLASSPATLYYRAGSKKLSARTPTTAGNRTEKEMIKTIVVLCGGDPSKAAHLFNFS